MSVSSQPFPLRPPRVFADPASGIEIVELTSLSPDDLEGLWSEERRHWKELLYWDSEPATALVRAAVRRRRLAGEVILRNDLATGRRTSTEHGAFQFEPWAASYTSRAAALMQQAHLGSVDAEMNEMYRTQEGCRSLLDNIMEQHGCGQLVPAASYALRKPRAQSLSGFLLTTEISAGHAHLAQVAVSPSAQGLGLGKLLLGRAIDALARAGYRSVSLMVSETNQRALSLYESMGFRAVLGFPVFSWDRLPPGSR